MAYLLKVAIDYGSTNTVTAFCVYEQDQNGTWVISKDLNPVNTVIHTPTIILFQEENPDHGAISQDLYGQAAENVIRNSNEPPKVQDNFKQLLYTKAPGSPEYQTGVELTTKFFVHLRTIYREKIYNILPPYVRSDMQTILYLSTPVRGNMTHRTLMRQMAVDAGFTADNGITEICTDYDEAQCVVRYAMETAREAMKDLLAKAGTPDGATLMFVDVGGSTMDVSLENLRIDLNGVETMDPISEWPSADVEYPLGGCLVDEAIKDYLIRKGYADPDYTEQKWKHGDGKYRFRKFKEENNKKLMEGNTIEKLGAVGAVCFDFMEEIMPPVLYSKAQQKIDRTVLINEICKEYIEHMYQAIETLFAKQREIPGKPRVQPQDVDAVFLAGDGSRLFFVEEILRSNRLGLTAIQQKPERLFSAWENPSLCCAKGALVEQENVITPAYAAEVTHVQLQIFDISANLDEIVTKNPYLLSRENATIQIDGKQYKSEYLSGKTYSLTEKYQMLPVHVNYSTKIFYRDQDQNDLAILITLWRTTDDGEKKIMGTPQIKLVKRDFANGAARAIKDAALTLTGIATAIVTVAADGFWKVVSGKDPQITEAVTEQYDAIRDMVIPKKTVEVNLSCAFTLTEHSQLTGIISLNSPYYKLESAAIAISF